MLATRDFSGYARLESREALHFLRKIQQGNRFVGRSLDTGLTPLETHFLIEVEAVPAISVTELGQLLKVSPATTSNVAKELEQRGLLKISVSRSDSRAKALSLTKKGLRTVEKVDSISESLLQQTMSRLGKERLSVITQYFRALADGLDVPGCVARPVDSEYRIEQRRVTRALNLLGNNVYHSGMSSSAFQVLAEVVNAAHPPQVTELARLLSIAQNSVSSVVSVLLKKKYIRKEQAETDQRAYLLRATQTGVAKLKKVEKNLQKVLLVARGQSDQINVPELHQSLRVFLEEDSPYLPSLPQGFEVEIIRSNDQREGARAFSAKQLVELGEESKIPGMFFTSEQECYLLKESGTISSTVITGNDKSGKFCISFSCSDSRISPWIFSAFKNKVKFFASS